LIRMLAFLSGLPTTAAAVVGHSGSELVPPRGIELHPSGKRCDSFVVNGVLRCGPSILIPGAGKCGTNALASYLTSHPHINATHVAEVFFDPDSVSPSELIEKSAPDVLPSDPNVWLIKDPSVFTTKGVAARLRASYPSATVVMTVCNPAGLPYRWFRHGVMREIGLRNSTVGKKGKKLRANVTAVQATLWRHDPTLDLTKLFQMAFSHDSEGVCMRSLKAIEALQALDEEYVWQGNFGAKNISELDCGTFLSQSVNARADKALQRFIDAGYVLNQTLRVVFLEGWKEHGAEYLTGIAQSVGLDPMLFPAVNFSQKVYSAEEESMQEEPAPDAASDRLAHDVSEGMSELVFARGVSPDEQYQRLPYWQKKMK